MTIHDAMLVLAKLADEAIQIQNACNLSGVIHGWSRAIKELREALDALGCSGTEAINKHPINLLWASKVEHLTGCDDMGKLTVAYETCVELKGKYANTTSG